MIICYCTCFYYDWLGHCILILHSDTACSRWNWKWNTVLGFISSKTFNWNDLSRNSVNNLIIRHALNRAWYWERSCFIFTEGLSFSQGVSLNFNLLKLSWSCSNIFINMLLFLSLATSSLWGNWLRLWRKWIIAIYIFLRWWLLHIDKFRWNSFWIFCCRNRDGIHNAHILTLFYFNLHNLFIGLWRRLLHINKFRWSSF